MKKGNRNGDISEQGRKEIALKRPVDVIRSDGVGMAQEIKPTQGKRRYRPTLLHSLNTPPHLTHLDIITPTNSTDAEGLQVPLCVPWPER